MAIAATRTRRGLKFTTDRSKGLVCPDWIIDRWREIPIKLGCRVDDLDMERDGNILYPDVIGSDLSRAIHGIVVRETYRMAVIFLPVSRSNDEDHGYSIHICIDQQAIDDEIANTPDDNGWNLLKLQERLAQQLVRSLVSSGSHGRCWGTNIVLRCPRKVLDSGVSEYVRMAMRGGRDIQQSVWGEYKCWRFGDSSGSWAFNTGPSLAKANDGEFAFVSISIPYRNWRHPLRQISELTTHHIMLMERGCETSWLSDYIPLVGDKESMVEF